MKAKCLICHKELEVTNEFINKNVYSVNGKEVVWNNTDIKCLICSDCNKIRQDILDNVITIAYGVDIANTAINSPIVRLINGIVLQYSLYYPTGVIFMDKSSISIICEAHKTQLNN